MQDSSVASPAGEIKWCDTAKTVAVVTSRLPYPGPAGNLRYMHSFPQFLEARGHRVHIILRTARVPFVFSGLRRYFPNGRVRIDAPGIVRLGRWHLVLSLSRVAKVAVSRLLSLLPAPVIPAVRRSLQNWMQGPTHRTDPETGSPVFLDTSQHTPSGAEMSFVGKIFDRIKPDAVLFDTISCAPYCQLLADTTTKYVVTHDVAHERHETFVDQGYVIAPRQIARHEEAAQLNAFDVVIAIQREEEAAFADMCPDRQVVTIPMPLTLTTPNPDEVVAGRCLFVGSVGLHNVDGLRWFLKHVWPGVIDRVPTATLHVCGAVCEEVRDPLPGVMYCGEVSDLNREYASAAVVVVPLRAGSGLKIKIVEAMSHGRACVTTKIGAQGLPRDDDPPFIVADRADAFVQGTVDLLLDHPRRLSMGVAAQEYCAPFTAEQAFAPLVDRGL